MKSSDILLSLENRRLEVWKTDSGKVCVAYADSEVKDGMFLVSVWGSGDYFEAACDSYLGKIRGKTLVFNSCSDGRREVTILG